MIRRAVVLLVAIAAATNVAVEYKVPGIDTWKPYGSASFDVDPHLHVSQEMAKGKVVGIVQGDAIELAEKAWEAFTPNTKVGVQRMEFKIEDTDNNSISFGSLDLTNVKSERKLAKILTHADFVFHVDADQKVIGASIRVAWDQLDDLSASHSRAGSVVVAKPIAPSRVIEDPPKPIELSNEEDLVDALQPRRVPSEPSFFRKYWWLILGGLMFFNALNRQPAEAPPAAPAAPPPPVQNSSQQKKH